MSNKRNKGARKKQLKFRVLPKAKNDKKPNSILASLGYKISKAPVDDGDLRDLPDEVQDQIESLYRRVQIKPIGTTTELELLIDIYPHIPQLYNYLYAAYASAGKKTKALKIMKDNYERNPSYLFAKLNYSDYLVGQGMYEAAAEIYDYKFDLAQLYPDRNTFHESEVLSFYGVIGHYYVMTNNYNKAMHCLKVLKALSTSHGYTLRLKEKLDKYGKFIA